MIKTEQGSLFNRLDDPLTPRRIVEEHGGRLEAQNRRPRGCTFTVTLPLEAAS